MPPPIGPLSDILFISAVTIAVIAADVAAAAAAAAPPKPVSRSACTADPPLPFSFADVANVLLDESLLPPFETPAACVGRVKEAFLCKLRLVDPLRVSGCAASAEEEWPPPSLDG